MAKDRILTVNAGSSSLRVGVFGVENGAPVALRRIGVSGLPERTTLTAEDAGTGRRDRRELPPPGHGDPRAAALDAALEAAGDGFDAGRLLAAAHRVVHGGRDFAQPVRVEGDVLDRLDALTPLAPSHQPHNLAPIRRLQDLYPGTPQVACFDTAFHRTMPPEAELFALPREISDAGVIRYGFHGLSYDYIAGRLAEVAPGLARGRTVVAHLGHGASMCALREGKSVATTMGMTALDGLPMGRRSGALDPGAVLHMIRAMGLSPEKVEEILYQRSGLLGLSGISGEMQDLLASDAPEAQEAVDVFVYRCQREIGSLAAALGGLDGLVFTAGIGEHAPEIRRRICEGLGWLGLRLDPAANEAGERRISAEGSAVIALMLPTDEEIVLARAAMRLAGGG